jgi:hypothetical protein
LNLNISSVTLIGGGRKKKSCCCCGGGDGDGDGDGDDDDDDDDVTFIAVVNYTLNPVCLLAKLSSNHMKAV